MSKKNKTIHTLKVLIVVLMALGVALSALAPAFAEEMTIEEMREEASDIKRELMEIKEGFEDSQREESRTVRVQNVPGDFSFQYNLREGARGEVARYMQAVLNADPDTRVAGSGPGSPGRETDFFGPATRNALLKFQRKHGIPATAFFGSQTREKMNQILRDGVTIRETVREDTEHLKERFRGLVERTERLREALERHGDPEPDDTPVEEKTLEDCERDIEKAEEYAEGKFCTMIVAEMSCGDKISYTARNGCIIDFLSRSGWK